MKPEDHEGPEGLERFDKTMTALLTVTAKKETKKSPPKRKKASKGPAFVLAAPLPPL
jgi:hypothetical protein